MYAIRSYYGVQGDGAWEEIVEAIADLNRHGEADVLIVGRGGGSLEDLWAFNEEMVVRAIHASEIPVISAVGHEVDVTIADFAADLRAPTPSAAAELVVKNRQELEGHIDHLLLQLAARIHGVITSYSIHYTKLYDPRPCRRAVKATGGHRGSGVCSA